MDALYRDGAEPRHQQRGYLDGVGTQVVARDFTGDKKPDIVVGNKKGTFVFIQETRKVTKAEWEKAQPKPATPATSGPATQ